MSQENRHIYRVCYTKGEKVKYISHLDFLRSVNRSFKRAKVPVKYSNGFNPHVLLNIALPCPVGVSSVCELLDIELSVPMDCPEIKKRLCKSLPDGIDVISVCKRSDLPDFFEITSAMYEAEFKSDKNIELSQFIAEKEFIIEKKSKRGMKEVNIKDFVHKMDAASENYPQYKTSFIIDAGSVSNLKPELLLAAMQKFYDAKFYDIKTERKEIYFK